MDMSIKGFHASLGRLLLPKLPKKKAHLVTINDAAEQAWLTAVFGHEFYWIGLSDTKKRGAMAVG